MINIQKTIPYKLPPHATPPMSSLLLKFKQKDELITPHDQNAHQIVNHSRFKGIF